jgi:hypothetical protein
MTFAELIGHQLDKPYEKGATGSDSYDCLGLLASLYWETGKGFPDHFQKWDKTNYSQYYTQDEEGAIKTVIEFFDSFMQRVPGKVAGDIMLVEQSGGKRFVAVYTGNGQGCTSFIRKGVSVFKIDAENKPIIIWRQKCQQPQQQ